MPPFGGPPGNRVVVDSALADHERIVVEAGTHSQSVGLFTKDMLMLTAAVVADIRQD